MGWMYALGLALGLLPAAVIGLIIHLVIRNPRVRTVFQAGCFALLLAPAILGGHEGGLVPAWFAIYSVLSNLDYEMSQPSELFWQAVYVIVPTLVTWGFLLGPVWRFNRRLDGSPWERPGPRGR